MQTHNSPLKAIREKCLDCSCGQAYKVVAQDLDWLGVYMTYVQCNIIGIDAIVVQGDTLKEPYTSNYPKSRILRTMNNMGGLI